MWYIWVSIGISIIVSLWVAFELQNSAQEKGYEGAKYFWIPFLLGIAGWAVVIALPDRRMNEALFAISKSLKEQNTNPKMEPNATDAHVGNTEPIIEVPKVSVGVKEATVSPDSVIPMPGDKEDREVCPICGEVQRAGRTKCWKCGIPFIHTK